MLGNTDHCLRGQHPRFLAWSIFSHVPLGMREKKQCTQHAMCIHFIVLCYICLKTSAVSMIFKHFKFHLGFYMREILLHHSHLRLKSVAAALSAHHGSDVCHGAVPGHQLFCFCLPGQLYQDEDKKIATLWYSVFGVDDFCPTNQRS